jgi:hypothetical protein
MTTIDTPEQKALNSAVAMKAARDRELATRRAEAAEDEAAGLRLAAGILWQTLHDMYYSVLLDERVSSETMDSAKAALDMFVMPAQEGETGE